MAVFEGIKLPTTGDFDADFAKTLDRLDHDEDLKRDLTSEHQGNPVTLGPRVRSPEDWAKDQVTRASNAASKWLKNVKTPRRDPLKAMVKAEPKRTQKVKEALEQKKWLKAVQKIDEALMYATIDQRGESAFRTGIEDRKDKVLARVKELQPMVAALAAQIDAMPDATDADREKRLLAARKGMIAIGKKRRGL